MSQDIHEILAEPGDSVTAGQPVARLYDGNLRAVAATAEQEIKREIANLEAAQARLALLRAQPTPEELKIAESRVEQARINLTARQQDLKRAQALYEGQRLFSQEDYARAKTSYDLAEASLKVELENLNLVRRGPLPAEMQQAEAAVRQTLGLRGGTPTYSAPNRLCSTRCTLTTLATEAQRRSPKPPICQSASATTAQPVRTVDLWHGHRSGGRRTGQGFPAVNRRPSRVQP